MKTFPGRLLVPLLTIAWFALPAAADGSRRLALDLDIDPGARSPDEAALFAVDAAGPDLGLSPGAATWSHHRTTTWRGRTLVHLAQVHRGVPVIGGRAVVKFDREGHATRINATVHPDLRVPTTPAVGPDAATAAARSAVELPDTAEAAAHLAVRPDARGGTLVYQVHLSARGGLDSWRVTVDAATGAIRGVTDLRLAAQGNVYEISPALDDPVEVTLTDLTGDMDVMSGTYALVRSMVVEGEDVSDTHLAQADESGDFLFEPEANTTEDPFVEVNAYHHVTALSHYFEDVHGHEFDGPALVTTNYVYEDGTGYDNAFYTTDASGNQVLCFGQGTYDFAYDAGVIAHEFGHSIVQTTTDMQLGWMIYDEYGTNNAPGGIHEGLADYWAGTYHGRSEVSSWVPIGRDLENDHTCPDDLVGESHEDGMIVGAAAWDIYLQVGKEAADDIVYGALLRVSDAPTFAELAEALLEAAGDLEEDGDLGADDLEAIQASLEDRGMSVCGRSLPMEPDEPFEFGLPLFMGMQEMDEEWCERMRDMGMNLVPSFQFALTTPPASEGTLEELEISIDMDRYDGAGFAEDELHYTFLIREGEMVEFDYELIESPNGHEFETPVPGEHDRELDDNPDEIVIALDDEDLELRADTTYYLTLIHRNCAAVDMTLEAELDIAAPPADDDDDDDGDGCNCRLSGGSGAPALGAGLGLALLAFALRRRR